MRGNEQGSSVNSGAAELKQAIEDHLGDDVEIGNGDVSGRTNSHSAVRIEARAGKGLMISEDDSV
jgi:hypothetical protein